MRVFIVHAHHEPSSFNAAMTYAAAAALRANGDEVEISDLYAMRFDPVSDRRNFRTAKDPIRLVQQVEEAHASQCNGYASELQAEMDKLAWCNALILQFPLWWLGMPAILKGWVDRVFAVGRAYGGGRYWSRGVFAGKRALCSVTVGGAAAAYSAVGAYGPIAQTLFPIQHGILGFVGFGVVEPFVVHAPSRMSGDERRSTLERYAKRVCSLADVPVSTALCADDYEGLVLRAALKPR